MSQAPVACCVLLFHPENGQVLAATRRGTTDSWGMVGGKKDAGETDVECAKREFSEETGVELAADPRFLLARLDDHGYETRVYLVDDPHDRAIAAVAYAAGYQAREGDLRVGFVPFSTLLAGPFARFNEVVLARLLGRASIDAPHVGSRSAAGTFSLSEEDIVRLDAPEGSRERSGWVNVGAFALDIQTNEAGDLSIEVHPVVNEGAPLRAIAVSRASALRAGANDLDDQSGLDVEDGAAPIASRGERP